MTGTELPDRFEVRPKAKHNAILLAVGCGSFTLAGLWMVVESQNTGEILAGILAVVFFGGGGVLAIPRLIRRSVSMVLTHPGIEQITLYGTATIHWKDIEKIGLANQSGARLVGIRLKTYDGYLANMSPELAGAIARSLPAFKLLTNAALLVEIASGQLWSSLDGWDTARTLKDFGKVSSLAQALFWSRKTVGYDITFSWADLDRSPDKFAGLLEQYRQNALAF